MMPSFRNHSSTAPIVLAVGPARPDSDEALAGLLASSLELGINAFDTSMRNAGERGQRLLGRILSAINPAQRCAPKLSLRIGYAPWARNEAHEIAPGVHSLAPLFLRWSIEQSLNNLGVERLELVFVEHPEAQRHLLNEPATYLRLCEAFELLESEVARGRVGAYGLACRTGPTVPADHPEHLSLPQILKAARAAGGATHHLRALAAPLDLLGAAGTQSLEGRAPMSAREAARTLGLDTFASGIEGTALSEARGLADFAGLIVEAQALENLEYLRGLVEAPRP